MKRHMNQNNFYRLVCIVALMFMGWIAIMTVYPYEPLTIHHQPYIVMNKNHEIKPGETILYVVDATKNIDINPTVSRKIVNTKNGSFITLSDITTSVPTGKHSTVSATTAVPTVTECGVYYLDLSISYVINYFHAPIVVHARTENFTVVGCT